MATPPGNCSTMTAPRNDDVYYFLGTVTSHIIHALPLYKQLGGTFVVLSEKAREELRPYGVPVLVIDDRPEQFVKLSFRIRATMRFLDRNAKVVLFYDLFKLPPTAPLRKATTIYLSHGNGLKQFMNMNPARRRAVRDYDFFAGVGPSLKQRYIEDGVDPAKLVDIGIARTDQFVRNRGKVVASPRLIEQMRIDPNRPVVAYVPTYWGATSVDGVGLDLVERVPDDVTLIFRPHPQTPDSILDRYRPLLDRSNVVYAPLGRFDVELVDILDAASVIVGDMSSVMVESILLDKPLIFARDAQGRDAADLAAIQDLVDYAGQIRVEDPGSIHEIIQATIERGIDAELWAATKERMFFNYDGTAVTAICDLVRSLCAGGR
jgi:hypothetical protein